MTLTINHVTGTQIVKYMDHLEEYYGNIFQPYVRGSIQNDSVKKLVEKFDLHMLKEMNDEEIMSHTWNTEVVDLLTRQCYQKVTSYISLPDLVITYVPALNSPYPPFDCVEREKWVSGYTNGPGHIIMAVPPNPNREYLLNMIAHEAHHASPDNPIYRTPYSDLTLADVIKMAGCAEFFSLSLFLDTRRWWDYVSVEDENRYWKDVKALMGNKDEDIKESYLFGDEVKGIPFFAGYTFGFDMVSQYMKNRPESTLKELFSIEIEELFGEYVI